MSFHQAPCTFIDQVSLKVANLERSLQFYERVVRLRILEQTSQSATLTADGKTPLLHLEQLEHVKQKLSPTTGLYHFALLLPTRADLADMLQHLANIDYPLGASDHEVSEALYIQDIDNNGIEIYADRPAKNWSWLKQEVVMTTKPLNVQDLLKEKHDHIPTYLPPETIIGHIHLHVSSLPESEKFYCDGLGFDLVNRYGSQAMFLSTGQYHHHIGMNTWAGPHAVQPEADHTGMDWFTIVYPNDQGRLQAIERLKQIGAEAVQSDGHWAVNDPSGNRILLTI